MSGTVLGLGLKHDRVAAVATGAWGCGTPLEKSFIVKTRCLLPSRGASPANKGWITNFVGKWDRSTPSPIGQNS